MVDDRTTISGYDDAATERLLGVAADVLRCFGSAFGGRHLAMVGGVVPTLLVPKPPRGMARHVGTGDLDLHLSLHLLDGETADYYQSIIDGLRDLGLEPAAEEGREIRWRWVGRHRGVRLQVEFLWPVRDRAGRPESPAAETPAEANIGPDGQITALAVGYGHLVPEDTLTVERRVEASGGWLTYPFPVAGLTSWLCLKTDAIQLRDKVKDAYDVVWAIDAMAPAEAASVVQTSPLLTRQYARQEVLAQLHRLTDDQFRDTESIGPRAYAGFLEADPPGPALHAPPCGAPCPWSSRQLSHPPSMSPATLAAAAVSSVGRTWP